jgi:hypothetical protein
MVDVLTTTTPARAAGATPPPADPDRRARREALLISLEAAQRSLIDTLDTAEQLSFPLAIPELESAIRPGMDGLWQPEADVVSMPFEVCDVAESILEPQ